MDTGPRAAEALSLGPQGSPENTPHLPTAAHRPHQPVLIGLVSQAHTGHRGEGGVFPSLSLTHTHTHTRTHTRTHTHTRSLELPAVAPYDDCHNLLRFPDTRRAVAWRQGGWALLERHPELMPKV